MCARSLHITGKYKLGGGSEKPVVTWVCMCGMDSKLSHRMVNQSYSSLLQPCRTKMCYSPER